MALSRPEADAIGQRAATLKVDGDNTPSSIYFAVRSTAPYAVDADNEVRDGIDAVFTKVMPNIARQYCYATDLEPDTLYYWGATTAPPGSLAAYNLEGLSRIQSGRLLEDNEILIVAGSLVGNSEIQQGSIVERSPATEFSVSITTAAGGQSAAMNVVEPPETPNAPDPKVTVMSEEVVIMAEESAVVVGGSFTTLPAPVDEESSILLSGVVRR